jgi:hypothetical protein
MRNAYKILVGKPEGKRPLGRPRNGWDDNITMDLREIGQHGTLKRWCPITIPHSVRTQNTATRIFTVAKTRNLVTFGFYKMRGVS